MTAAYVLLINMFVAGVFAVAFAVVSATIPSSRGARWMACGYAMGILYVVLNFALSAASDARPLDYVIFLVFTLAMNLCLVAMARHYRVGTPTLAVSLVWLYCAVAGVLIVNMPDASLLRAFLYQSPYFVMQLLCAVVILRSRHRHPLDILLLVLHVLAAFTYLSRPLVALALGDYHAAQDYIGTTYAAISQTIGAFTLISLALVVLLVMVRDGTVEMIARAETDALSGALNRRGFEQHAEKAVAAAVQAGVPVALVAADIDHFKRINDDFGHDAGDRAIARFVKLLRKVADRDAVIGRLGGEEFAILLPGATLAMGRLYAEGVRAALAAELLPGVDRPVTASFGVKALDPDEALSDALAKVDTALYDAKKSGRDRVCVTAPSSAGWTLELAG